MELTKHEIWNVFEGAETIESFEANYARPLFLKEEVPNSIKEAALVSQKLLLHSYYEYDFIDIALTHAIFLFEKALKTRWFEINNAHTTLNFYKLIDWFSDRNYFETWNNKLPHQLRLIRNGKVHDEKNSLGGVVFLRKVFETFDLINDIYEDPQLRTSRKNEVFDLTDKLTKLTKEGTILSFNHNDYIIFEVYPVFINNKLQPSELTLLVYPIFDLTQFNNFAYHKPPGFTITVINWTLDANGFSAFEVRTKIPVLLRIIKEEIDVDQFEKWYSCFYKMDNWPLINFITTEPMDDLLTNELRNFHQA